MICKKYCKLFGLKIFHLYVVYYNFEDKNVFARVQRQACLEKKIEVEHGSQFCDINYKGLSNTSILVWQRGRGSENL